MSLFDNSPFVQTEGEWIRVANHFSEKTGTVG